MTGKPPESTSNNTPILRLEGITKRYGDLTANNNISLSINKGEVHVLFGENGAGKSTLSNIIYGYKRPDEGKIFLNGEEVQFRSPRDAAAHSIGMVHQHFMLVPTLSGLKNILLGLDYGKRPVLDLKSAEKRAAELCSQYGVNVDLKKEIWRLSVGEQQWVEILKALFLGSTILILDEPTAVLTPQETETLLNRIIEMKKAGITVILVSHKLKEIDRVSDRISVLRQGNLIGTVETGKVTHKELINMMVGRNYDICLKKQETVLGEPVLEVENVSARNMYNRQTLTDVSFTVRKGEIFGVAGVSGNGQTDLYEVLTALKKCSAGSIRINGETIHERLPFLKWHGMRVGEIPEDRITHGTIGSMTLQENIIFGKHRDKRFWKMGMLNWDTIGRYAKEKLEQYDVRPAKIKCPAQALSGGNLQKLVLSRELSDEPCLIIAAQPTRGLDIVAVESIWNRLLAEKAKGVACVVISEDLDELIALSDRIGVLYSGEMVEIFEGEFDHNEIGEKMIKGRSVTA